jgi:toxin FitB
VIILDTNVLSELMRPMPSAQVVSWVSKQPAVELFITSITEAEIFYGIELLAKGKRRDGLLAAAEAMFDQEFAGRILDFDSNAARVFSRIAARRRGIGQPISHADAQIAAIAQLRGAALATHNASDFANCEIRVIDPWRS